MDIKQLTALLIEAGTRRISRMEGDELLHCCLNALLQHLACMPCGASSSC